MKAKTRGPDDLKAIVAVISTLIEEATFTANSEGITFRGMDPSHVGLVDITWPSTAFEEYVCDQDVRFGVRIDEFGKIVKRADKKEDIEISLADQDMLLMAVGRNKKYKIRLIEVSANDTPLPNIPFDTKIKMPAAAFGKIMADVDVVADYVTMSAEDSKASFAGRGDSGEVNIDVDATGDIQISASPGSSTYSLEYILPITKGVGTAIDTVICEFSDAKPLRIEFPFMETGRMHFYLAPRVES